MKALIGSVILLAGCATMPPPFEPKGPCQLDEATRMRFAAVKYRSNLRDELAHRTNSAVVRVLRPGDMATMDLREDRLNVSVDEDGQIAGLRCG